MHFVIELGSFRRIASHLAFGNSTQRRDIQLPIKFRSIEVFVQRIGALYHLNISLKFPNMVTIYLWSILAL
jgi:hypothetical protein